MKRILLLSLICISLNAKNSFAQFTPDNLVIVRIGDGTTTLGSQAAPVFFDEYKTDGTLVQSVALPTTVNGVNKRLTLSGNKLDEGYISLSPDGQKIALFGYDCAPGYSAPATAVWTAVLRTVGVITPDLVINTTKDLSNFFSGVAARSAIVNGNDIWVTGGGTGIVYSTYNSTGAWSNFYTVTTNTGRALGIYGGQLYASTVSTNYYFATVGTGLPTSTGQTLTNLPGLPKTSLSPYQFVLTDQDATVAGADVLYITDVNGLEKYSLLGSAWVSNGKIAGTFLGLTGKMFGGSAVLYGTRNTAEVYDFISIEDNSGYNAILTGSVTIKASLGANKAFRGISFTPGTIANILPVSLANFTGKMVGETVRLDWTTFSENNNSYFEVQRSADGVLYNKLNVVKGSGNSSRELKYSFVDLNPTMGNNYYRLKQVDADGHSTESSVIFVKSSGKSSSISIFSKAGNLKVTINSVSAGKGTISIYDLSGRKVIESVQELYKGTQQIILENHAKLTKGIYVASLVIDAKTIECKFINE